MEILQKFPAFILRHSDISDSWIKHCSGSTRSDMGIRLSIFFTIRSLTLFISGGSLGVIVQIFLIQALISGMASGGLGLKNSPGL